MASLVPLILLNGIVLAVVLGHGAWVGLLIFLTLFSRVLNWPFVGDYVDAGGTDRGNVTFLSRGFIDHHAEAHGMSPARCRTLIYTVLAVPAVGWLLLWVVGGAKLLIDQG